MSYLASLNPMNLFGSLPGNIAQGLIWGLMALGVYITFRLLDFADLTVDGTFATGGAVTVVLILHGWSAPAALLVAVLAGLAAGLITGLLHTLLGIPPILAGILTQIALYSINLNIMGMANLAVSVDNYPLILSLRKVTQSILISLIFAAVIIAILYWYFGTEQGSSIRATGCNPAMSKAQGININFTKVLALAISNGLVGLSGGLMAQYQGFSDINMGRGAIVIGLAAVIIGDVLFSRIFRNFALRLLGVAIGAIVYYVVIQVVLWLGLDSNYLKLLSALVVAVFLAMPYWKGKYFSKRVKRGGKAHA